MYLTVLGRTRLLHHPPDDTEPTDLTPTLTRRQREVLAYLALHRDGAHRDTLTATLWPDAPPDRPYNTFHATVSQLRRTLRTATHNTITDITTCTDGYYTLDPDQTDVDLWHLQHALETTHHLPEPERRPAPEHTIDLYIGDFAADLSADWTEAPREALHRAFLDTVSSLIRTLRTTDPEEALTLLERARTFDRHNEAIYRDIARFQAHLGQHDAIPRTLALLTTVRVGGSTVRPARPLVVAVAFVMAVLAGTEGVASAQTFTAPPTAARPRRPQATPRPRRPADGPDTRPRRGSCRRRAAPRPRSARQAPRFPTPRPPP